MRLGLAEERRVQDLVGSLYMGPDMLTSTECPAVGVLGGSVQGVLGYLHRREALGTGWMLEV